MQSLAHPLWPPARVTRPITIDRTTLSPRLRALSPGAAGAASAAHQPRVRPPLRRPSTDRRALAVPTTGALPSDPRRSARGALCRSTAAPLPGSGPAPRSCSLGAIDDATSEILALHFRPPRSSTPIPRSSALSPPTPAAGDLRRPAQSCSSATSPLVRRRGTGRDPVPHSPRACCKTSASPMSPPTRRKPSRIERLWRPCKIASSASARARLTTVEAPPLTCRSSPIQPPLRKSRRRPACVARPPADMALVLCCRYRPSSPAHTCSRARAGAG